MATNRRGKWLGGWVVAGCLALAGGCAHPQAKKSHPAIAGDLFVAIGKVNPFYKYGPSQAFGPDFKLAPGQKVTLVKREFGFSKIRLADGAVGYVSADDIKPAPPEPKIVPTQLASRVRTPRAKPEPERALDLSDVPAPPMPE